MTLGTLNPDVGHYLSGGGGGGGGGGAEEEEEEEEREGKNY